MLFVNAMALVMLSAAQPAQSALSLESTDSEKIAVMKIAIALSISSRIINHRLIIQKKYHILCFGCQMSVIR